VAHSGTPTIQLLLDNNADGDIVDHEESLKHEPHGGAETELTQNGVDRAYIATGGFLLIGLTN
jgi:hypothetical protein